MSATTDIYVTPSTSLVLLKNLSSITNVYLRPFAVPSFSLTIRDTTGLSSLLTRPVRISTLESARFSDGGSLYLLNQPYGLVNLSLRNSNVWQLNHTSGQAPENAAATVGNLSVNQLYLQIQSTVTKVTSTFLVGSLTTPTSISIAGPFVVSNLSTPGFVLFEQTLNVYGDALMRNILDVKQTMSVLGSFSAVDVQPISQQVHIFSSLGVGGNVFVKESLIIQSTLSLRSTVQVNSVQVTQSSLSTDIKGDLSVVSLVSSLGGFLVGGSLQVGGNVYLQRETVLEGSLRATNVQVGGPAVVLGSLSSVSLADIASTLFVADTFSGMGRFSFASSIGLVGPLFTSSFSTFHLSSFGSVSTSRVEIQSDLTTGGSVSTVNFQTLSSMVLGTDLFTPATISSLRTTECFSSVSVKENALFRSLFTSTLGGMNTLSIVSNGIAKQGVIFGDTTARELLLQSDLDIGGNVGVRNTVTVYGDLTILGASEISSINTKSYVLESTLQITTSSPNLSFQASSLIASSIFTGLTRIFPPNPYTISTVYASTVEGVNGTTAYSYFSSLEALSFFTGPRDSLAETSQPTFVLNTKTQFVEGLSTLQVDASFLQAITVEGSLFGNVDYLSNVAIPFSNISGITLTMSTVTSDLFFASSFQTSTLINAQFMNVQSSLRGSYLTLDAQGIDPTYTTSQFLNVNPQLLAMNRSLFFDRTTNRIGISISSPQFDLDISGLVYASNIFYSSINPLIVRREGTVVLSTVFTSSSYVHDSLQYGSEGLRIYSQAGPFGTSYLEINNFPGYSSNLLGIYNATQQSSIVMNTALGVTTQKVFVNPFQESSKELRMPTYNLEVQNILRATEIFISSGTILDCVIATNLVSPYLEVNGLNPTGVNTISTAYETLFLNSFFTVKTNLYDSNQNVGIFTSNPQHALDVYGNAYFSTTVPTFLRTNYLAMGSKEI